MRLPLSFLSFAVSALAPFATSQSAPAAPRDASGMRRIVMLGDSLTDGYRLQRAQAYPALIGQKLRAAGLNGEVVNAGVSGDTTSGGLRRIPQYLREPVDILLIELGINDAFRGVPIDEMRANLQAIIDRTRERNANVQIVIAGMQLPLYGADGYVREFGEMFGELARKNHAALIPYLLLGVGGDPTLNLPDRIHPNAAGHRILAENVWRVLEPLVRKATAGPVAHVD
ncbi:MAG: arylesterase [Verrucomicrobiota bacterium]|nr:arylesterase [Verrucomicrobiota bacterium]